MNEQFCVTGARTTIVKALVELLGVEPIRFDNRRVGVLSDFELAVGSRQRPPLDVERYVLAHGHLQSKTISEQEPGEIARSLQANLTSTVQLCEYVLENNPAARICILGSESGIRGSHDTTYALAKAAVHAYVRWRRVEPLQQLVCVAPGMIGDAGMTTRRVDRDRVERRTVEHPRGRLLTSREVARMIAHLLWDDGEYITNTVVEMYGGQR